MKWPTLLIAAVWLLAGCCTKPTPCPPRAVEEFDGNKIYRADLSEYPNTWAINLPQTSCADQVTAITVWVNTTGVEGHRVGKNIYCDQVQLVNDDTVRTVIASGDIFLADVENATHDIDEVTAGSARGLGDVFTLREDGSDAFRLLRKSLSNARILVRLVNKQPSAHAF